MAEWSIDSMDLPEVQRELRAKTETRFRDEDDRRRRMALWRRLDELVKATKARIDASGTQSGNR